MAIPTVKISLNPHWYSKFWIKQFYELYCQGKIRLRPSLTRVNPPYCFYFEVEGRPCLVDVSDHKKTLHDPGNYFLYFKANYDLRLGYPGNVRKSFNGTTLTRLNTISDEPKDFDLVWLTGVSGGRLHKVAMLEALASLPLKMRLAAKMVTAEDTKKWGPRLAKSGVEIWTRNLPYRDWLELNKRSRWCVLARGKHDCLSFKMIDYFSIGAPVLVDYPPTSVWPVPIEPNVHYLSFYFSGPQTNDLSPQQFEELCVEYRRKTWSLLPMIKDENQQRKIGHNNFNFFITHIGRGRVAERVLTEVIEAIHGK